MRHYRLCILGFGNVGQALVQILIDKHETLKSVHGVTFSVTGVADIYGGAVDPKGLDMKELLTAVQARRSVAHYPEKGELNITAIEVIKSSGADILIELTPTNITDGQPALSHILHGLRKDMHIVTANKGPVVAAYKEIMKHATVKGKMFKFGGATAGALPTINVGYYDVAGSEINAIEGIPNGTTNFILTEMTNKGITFEDALNEAQRLGIAETNPKLDIEGFDTANKMVILATALMGYDEGLAGVQIQGITHVTQQMIKDVKQSGKVIKLIGKAEKKDGKVKISVAPVVIEPNHSLAGINGTEKAIAFQTDLLGTITISGGNSGRVPAAAAVLRDLINLSREDRT